MATATALVTRLDNREAEYRVQPHNIEAEQALLGAILVNNDAFYRVSTSCCRTISSSRSTSASSN